MTDILIRAVPGAVIDEIDRQASGLGISRTEFLRRRLSREFRPVGGLTTEDLVRLAGLIGDVHSGELPFAELAGPVLPDTEIPGPGLADPDMVDGASA
ncbi:type II toxin-antitoxin system VapB family antitoxin [Nocardia sp. NBC_00416]|uniref:type II toxin-antitoxin system VapB family antitoxin n=1 Tax=Nocardia sp. NBC_00416 TaxID=2975991 RepID=UPI002E22C555